MCIEDLCLKSMITKIAGWKIDAMYDTDGTCQLVNQNLRLCLYQHWIFWKHLSLTVSTMKSLCKSCRSDANNPIQYYLYNREQSMKVNGYMVAKSHCRACRCSSRVLTRAPSVYHVCKWFYGYGKLLFVKIPLFPLNY